LCRRRDLNTGKKLPPREKDRPEGQILRKSGRLKGRTLPPRRGRAKSDGGKTCVLKRDKMSSDAQSSSNETKTDDNHIAAGMMNLAIVCAHVQKEAAPEVLPAGNVPPRSVGLLVARVYVNVRSITLRSSSFFVFGFGLAAIGTCVRHADDRVLTTLNRNQSACHCSLL